MAVNILETNLPIFNSGRSVTNEETFTSYKTLKLPFPFLVGFRIFLILLFSVITVVEEY